MAVVAVVVLVDHHPWKECSCPPSRESFHPHQVGVGHHPFDSEEEGQNSFPEEEEAPQSWCRQPVETVVVDWRHPVEVETVVGWVVVLGSWDWEEAEESPTWFLLVPTQVGLP